MKTKPTEFSETQVLRIMDLWFKFYLKKYGIDMTEEQKVEEFIEWLHGGQK